MIFLGTCDRNRGLENVVNIYKAWKSQTINFNFGVLDCNEQPLQFPDFMKDIHSQHKPYVGENNISFMINVGLRWMFNEFPNTKYVQLVGNETFPCEVDYLEKCLLCMRSYDIVVPNLVRSSKEEKLGYFESFYDESYLSFINKLGKKFKDKFDFSFLNTGPIFAKKEVFEELCGYDESYSMWGREDDDFVIRAQQAGFKTTTIENLFLAHDYHPFIYEKDDFGSKEVQERLTINNTLLRLTKQGKLPIKRNFSDWGLHGQPRPNLDLINSIKSRKLL